MVCSLRSMGMALVISSVLLAGCGGDDDDTVPAEGAPIASTTTEQVSTPPADGDTVTVVLHDLRGAAGQQFAGVLYRGPAALDPDDNVVGGFGATVDADPFSATLQVHRPDDEGSGPFPGVSDDALLVPDSTYTLVLWLAPDLGPYSRWVPAAVPGLEACELTFTVDGATTVDIDGQAIAPLARGTTASCDR